jgi:hypothetical protein
MEVDIYVLGWEPEFVQMLPAVVPPFSLCLIRFHSVLGPRWSILCIGIRWRVDGNSINRCIVFGYAWLVLNYSNDCFRPHIPITSINRQLHDDECTLQERFDQLFAPTLPTNLPFYSA